MTYQELDTYLGAKTDRPAPGTSNNTRAIRMGEKIGIRLHSTVVLVFSPDGSVVINDGGWKTVTTKARINEYLGKWRITQEHSRWYLYRIGDWNHPWPFVNGMRVRPEAEEPEYPPMALWKS